MFEEEAVHARLFRMAALAVVVCVIPLFLSACGGSSSGGGDGKKVTIKFLTGQAENARDEAEAKSVVDDFNKANPDIEVKREAIPPDNVRTVLKTRLASGSGPDVFVYDTGPGFGGVLVKAGLVAPLDDAYKSNNWKIYPWARARATYGGVTYGVPVQVEELGIFYNKDLFAKLGVQPPKTVEELTRIADLAKQQGLTPMAFGDKDQWPAGHQFSMAVSNVLGRKGLDDILYGNGSWNTPEVVKAIDVFFHQFQQSGYFPKGTNGIGYDDANALFYGGKAAMLPTGTWLVSDLSQKAPFKVGFFPFPSIDGSAVAPPAGVGAGWFVSKSSAHQAAAIKFINYMISEKTARRGLEKLNDIPAFKVNLSGLKISPLFTQVLTDLSKSESDEAFGYNIDVLTPSNFNDVMSSGFQDVLNGTRTPAQQAALLEAAWEKAKKAGDILKKS
jgi:raffinose/stachyose/melibiose transport system substrate-binding protein